MAKNKLNELARIATSFEGLPPFLVKHGCSSAHQRKLQKSIGSGFLRLSSGPKKRNQTAMADENFKDFLM